MAARTVLHVCETAKGGVGTYLNMLGEADPQTVRNVFVVPEMHRSHIDPALEVIAYGDAAGDRGAGLLLAMVRAARRAVREIRPDVVFCHSSFPLALLLSLKVIGPRVPTLYNAHGWAATRYAEGSAKARLVARVEGWLAGLASRTISISEWERDFAAARGYRGRHVVVENAVTEAKPVAPVSFPEGATHLLFVGRFDRQKGLDLLLEAFSRLKRDDIHLHLIGAPVADGDRAIEDRARAMDRVTVHGWVTADRIDAFYAAADCLVVPSRWEGFGLVIAEAARNGTPALVSDRGAMKTVVTPGETGLVFPLPSDEDVSGLTAALEALDPCALRAMAAPARAAYESRFSAEGFTRRITALYEEIAP